MSKLSVDYFINKFEAIPDHMWITGSFGTKGGPRCASGHCNLEEGRALDRFFENRDYYITAVNDNNVKRFNQSTPKKRVIACLKEIKRKRK